MAAVLLQATDINSSLAAGATQYHRAAIAPATPDATENVVQILFRTAGTFSNLYINVLTNDRAASTLRTRVNAGNGNQVVTITGSTTGKFEDTSNTDTVTAGQEWATEIVGGAGGTTFTYSVVQLLFAASSNTVARYSCAAVANTSNSATRYSLLSGPGTLITTEAQAELRFVGSATLKNMAVNVTANARTSTTTFRSRINAANGALVVSVTSGTTGVIEDTSNSDSVTAGQDINYSVATGTGSSESITYSIAVDAETTDSSSHLFAGGSPGAIATSVTTYAPCGGLNEFNTTEGNAQAEANLAFTASDLEINLSANGIETNSTLRFRVNGANGNQAVTITGSTTGWFTDAVNTDSVVAADLINYQLVTGAAGTNLTSRGSGMLAVILATIDTWFCSNLPYPNKREIVMV